MHVYILEQTLYLFLCSNYKSFQMTQVNKYMSCSVSQGGMSGTFVLAMATVWTTLYCGKLLV